MLLLRANNDDLQIVTESAADIEVHLSAMVADSASPPAIKAIPDLGPLASITTATTTTVIDSSAISGIASGDSVNVQHCNIRNNHASVSCAVSVQITDGTNTVILARAVLLPGEMLVFSEGGAWMHFDANAGLYPAGESADIGYALEFSGAQGATTDGQTLYLASPAVLLGTDDRQRLYVPRAGLITRAYLNVAVSGTLGSTEQGSAAIRLNGATDITISSAVQYDAVVQSYSNVALNQAVAQGDRLALKIVTPTWATNPSTVLWHGVIWVKNT